MKNRSYHEPDGQTLHPPGASHAPAGTALQDACKGILTMARLGRELRNATNALEKTVHAASGTDDLTLLHWAVLAHLACESSSKQLDVKSTTGIAPAHLTRLLDELTDRRLVRRHRSPSDRRQIVLALTQAGRESARRLLTSLGERIDQTQLDAMNCLGLSLEQFVDRMASNDKPWQAPRM
ncbi:MarR family winged helix-turn-helix transcriptional regulator [Dyella flava]|uniref:MarR family transcriptional regulator n=1 Tax=Dyella flava TaxID=1920170 RepID=A0ABS2K3T2_9GAMM|nr:MarR family transcriptional regulator [Dyella flava]MBM7125320.1 MarR family transcriptional regulator [Dyella flava]GLQ50631.1 hypothetical protein GCM10010872_20800 [Dyella flava]